MSLTSNFDSSYNSRFKNDKDMNWAKIWKVLIWFKKKKKFPCRLLSFRFCPIPKIENSEISEICLLLQILTAVLIQHFVQLVVDTIALAFIAFYLFMIIKQRFCNCNSKNFTWFLFFLIYILGLLVCNCNLALIRLYIFMYRAISRQIKIKKI